MYWPKRRCQSNQNLRHSGCCGMAVPKVREGRRVDNSFFLSSGLPALPAPQFPTWPKACSQAKRIDYTYHHMCGSRKYASPPNGGSLQIWRGGGGMVLRPILILKEHLRLNLNFQKGGVGYQINKNLWGEVWIIFMNNTTQKKSYKE